MSQMINNAQNDPKIKVILIHGGKFYSSGNDLKPLTGFIGSTDTTLM